MQPLKLAAFDAEDLTVISTQLQDAVVLVGDLAYLPATRRFVVVANRFRWEKEGKKGPHISKGHERVRTGLHFDTVLSVKARNIRQDLIDGILNLLSVQFVETEAPSGEVVLTFSDNAEIRLEVEALEAHLQDITEGWETDHKPTHDLDD